MKMEKMTRERAMDYLLDYCGWMLDSSTTYAGGNDPCDEFYINGLMEGDDIPDIDRYAWLNTLFGYDIGRDNARQIDSYLYGEMDEMETLELTHRDKPVLQMVCERLKLNVKFDKWATIEPDVYHYF